MAENKKLKKIANLRTLYNGTDLANKAKKKTKDIKVKNFDQNEMEEENNDSFIQNKENEIHQKTASNPNKRDENMFKKPHDLYFEEEEMTTLNIEAENLGLQMKRELDTDKLNNTVIQLLLKNKVNKNNAFEIPLPSITGLSEFQNSSNEDWKKFSVTLDAGSKIYGFRVDSVYAETYKILGEFSRSDLNNMKDGDKEKTLGEEKKEAHSKNKSSTAECTLEKNVENINTNKYDLEFEVDPLFKITSAKFDASGAQGLLLNHLNVDSQLCLIFSSDLLNQSGGNPNITPSKTATKNKNPRQTYMNFQNEIDKAITKSKTPFCAELQQFKSYCEEEFASFGMQDGSGIEYKVANSAEMNKENENSIGFEEPINSNGNEKDDEAQLKNLLDRVSDYQPTTEDDLIRMEAQTKDNENEMEEESQEINPIFIKEEPYQREEINENTGDFTFGTEGTDHVDPLKRLESRFEGIGNGPAKKSLLQGFDPEEYTNDLWKKRAGGPKKPANETKKPKKEDKTKINFDFTHDMEDDDMNNEIDRIFQQSTLGSNKKTKKKSKKGVANASAENGNEDIKVVHKTLMSRKYDIEPNLYELCFLKTKESEFEKIPETADIVIEDEFDVNEDTNENEIDTQLISNLTTAVQQFKEKSEIFTIDFTKINRNISIRELKVIMWDSFMRSVSSVEENMNSSLMMSEENNDDSNSFSSIYSSLDSFMEKVKHKKISMQSCFLTVLHLANEKVLKLDTEGPDDFTIKRSEVSCQRGIKNTKNKII